MPGASTYEKLCWWEIRANSCSCKNSDILLFWRPGGVGGSSGL